MDPVLYNHAFFSILLILSLSLSLSLLCSVCPLNSSKPHEAQFGCLALRTESEGESDGPPAERSPALIAESD